MRPEHMTRETEAPRRASERKRVTLLFDGDLDDVPSAAGAALAGVARGLLKHCDDHAGMPATLRVARLGSRLNLWLTDPECSPTCLGGSDHIPSMADQHHAPPGDVRLDLDSAPDGGLRLQWALVLADEPATSFAPSQRRGDGRRATRGTRAGHMLRHLFVDDAVAQVVDGAHLVRSERFFEGDSRMSGADVPGTDPANEVRVPAPRAAVAMGADQDAHRPSPAADTA